MCDLRPPSVLHFTAMRLLAQEGVVKAVYPTANFFVIGLDFLECCYVKFVWKANCIL